MGANVLQRFHISKCANLFKSVDGKLGHRRPVWGNRLGGITNGSITTTLKTGGNLSNSNLYVNSNGLNITAIVPSNFTTPQKITNANNHPVNSTEITSAKIDSSNYFSQTYGLFQFTASVPSGSGLWPALWMMPKNSSYGGWPKSGEIDVFESGPMWGLNGHGNTQPSDQQEQGSYHSPAQAILKTLPRRKCTTAPAIPVITTQDVHTYDLLWLPAGATFNETLYPHGVLAWYVDGELYETQTGSNAGTSSTGCIIPEGRGPRMLLHSTSHFTSS